MALVAGVSGWVGMYITGYGISCLPYRSRAAHEEPSLSANTELPTINCSAVLCLYSTKFVRSKSQGPQVPTTVTMYRSHRSLLSLVLVDNLLSGAECLLLSFSSSLLFCHGDIVMYRRHGKEECKFRVDGLGRWDSKRLTSLRYSSTPRSIAGLARSNRHASRAYSLLLSIFCRSLSYKP